MAIQIDLTPHIDALSAQMATLKIVDAMIKQEWKSFQQMIVDLKTQYLATKEQSKKIAIVEQQKKMFEEYKQKIEKLTKQLLDIQKK